MPHHRRGAPSGGLLARLFCFAPHARVRNMSLPARDKQQSSKAAAAAAPAGAQAAPASPASAEALAAYLGTTPLPAPFGCTAPPSVSASTPQTSSGSVASSSGDGGWRGGMEAGYDGDSDCPEAGSPVTWRRRFAPAVRHARAAGQPAAQAPAGEGQHQEQRSKEADGGGSGPAGTGMQELAQRLEQLSAGGSSSSQGRTHSQGANAVAPYDPEQAAAMPAGETPGSASGTAPLLARPSPFVCPAQPQPGPGGGGGASVTPSGSAASLPALGATPSSRSYSRLPSRNGSVLIAADGSSTATASHSASSISLAHFLGASSSGGGSGKRLLKRLGSARVVVSEPASPEAGSPSAASAAAAATAPHVAPAAAAQAAMAVEAAKGGTGGGGAAGGVQRRLSDIHSGHYISLHKLQRQCGNLDSGEPWSCCSSSPDALPKLARIPAAASIAAAGASGTNRQNRAPALPGLD